jgi:hypothetical protein
MARAVSRWYVVALPVLVGCGVELTAPFSTPTRLNVSVSVTDTSGTGSASVAAQLTLDPAIWDVPDAIAESSLVVNGSSLRPMPHAEGTALRYSSEWALDGLTTDGTMVVQFPRLAGPDGTYEPMTLAVPLRSGDREIVLASDDDLVLHLVWPAGSSTPRRESDHWRLEVRGSEGGVSVLSFRGTRASGYHRSGCTSSRGRSG